MSDKAVLKRYLTSAREAVLWKLDGLSEYDVRRPMTRTGTNLLGVVKHLAVVEGGYLGSCFGRPFPEPMHWFGPDAEPNADMWATAEESREHITGLYQRVWVHTDAVVEELSLDAPGSVPWWPPERREVTLGFVLVHLVAEVNRHAGHLDVVRELVDGRAGLRPGNDNLPGADEQWWADYRQRLEQVARNTQTP